MELNKINSTGSWGKESENLNNNFTKVNNAIEQVKNATTRNKGYFSSASELMAAFPTANVGDIAYVGNAYPYAICKWNGSVWESTGSTGGEESVNLGNYYTKSETNEKFTETDEKLSELGSKVMIHAVHGIEFELTPTKIEEDTLYRTDGSTSSLNGFNANTYSLSIGDIVRIKVVRDFPSLNLAIIAFKDNEGTFKSILSSPLTASNQPDIYLTITEDIKELITVGCELVGLNTKYNAITKEEAEQFKDYIDLTYEERKYGWVNAENIETETLSFYLYKFDVRGSSKLKLYFASLGSYSLFTDAENNIVGTPFRNTSEGSSISTWKEIDVPEGAVYLKLSTLRNIGTNSYPHAYPCKVLANRRNFDEISDVIIRKNYVDAFYTEKKKYWVNKDNVETRADSYNLYYFDVNGIERVKIFFATGGAWALFLDADNNIVGEPFRSERINNDHYVSAWSEIEVPDGAVTLKVSSIKPYTNYAEEIGNIYPCRVLLYKSNNDSFQEKINEMEKSLTLDYVDLIYSSRKDGWINAENVENANAAMYLYEFDVRNSTKLKVYFASGSAYALFLDADGNILGEPFQSTPINNGNSFYASTWKDVEAPQGAITLRLSHVKLSNSFPLAYPCRVLADKQNYDKLKLGKSVINKTMVNVGMSIWWQDGRTFSESNLIDGNGALVKGYQTLLQEVFVFNKVIKYAYSGFSLGIGDVEESSIMATKADTWTSQPNAIWTLDTITNDFGRMVPLGVPSDFDNNTGINTFYGALRAFKDKVEELSPGAIVVCSNALYRTKKTNSLNLTLEDYETAMCYAAAKSGWYFVDQYRNSINDANIGVALYDGLHATNFGFRLAVKPWIEQFRNLYSIL